MQQLGMTIWSTNNGQSSSPIAGHTFIELWNNYGTHNTFSRWNGYVDTNDNNTGVSNNIADKDKITVDHPTERQLLKNGYDSLYGTYLSSYRSTWSWLNKSDWDYIVFGSGYRSNYKYNGMYIDLGGIGTYDGSVSKSRDKNYNAGYWANGTGFCTGYSLAMWKNFRDSSSTNVLDNIPWWDTNPSGVYNRL